MNWIRENTFWSSVTAIILLLIVGVAYVRYTTPIANEEQKVEQLVSMLNAWVEKSREQPDDKAMIPPKTYKKRLQENEKRYQEDINKLVKAYLELGEGIEVWFNEKPFPGEGEFETFYRDRQDDLETVLAEFESGQQQGGGLLPGGGQQNQRIEWAENPGQNMRAAQKQFWIMKRLVYDAVDAGVKSIRSIEFKDQPSPIQVLDGQRIADRYLVSSTVVLSPDKIGTLLSNLLRVKADLSNLMQKKLGLTVENDSAPDLMMHVNRFRMKKNRTTSSRIAERADKGEGPWFIYPLKINKELSEWELKDASFQVERPVTLTIDIMVHDPYEPTIASLLQETIDQSDLKEGQTKSEVVKQVFRSFYSEEEVNRFLNSNQ